MTRAPLLLEIGSEEIPARMIRAAASELAARVTKILDQARLARGQATCWCGPRRLAVRVDDVERAQPDRDELTLGPPVSVAFDATGAPTKAALGFARKLGIDPGALERRTTDKGEYVGVNRHVKGSTVGSLLARELPPAVAGMSFPKTMRWGEGTWRWVRPVHWVLARHGVDLVELELFGVRSAGWSVGHRFLSDGRAPVDHPDRYLEALEQAHVVADPDERRRRLAGGLERAAATVGGEIVADRALLDEVADLVEWPGTVAGTFDEKFLKLPRELLVTTLRHHQKCFSVQRANGELLAAFVAVANTDRDPAGHVRRGNEWVIRGRLEDARFFWSEDLARPLTGRVDELDGVVFHAKLGTFTDKAERMTAIAARLAEHLGLDETVIASCRRAARMAKVDLVSGTVGEFPELQGQAGGLLLAETGEPEAVARGVYEHYRPMGPDDALPQTVVGSVVAVADKLDTIAAMVGVGEVPTGSRDPFGIRRAASGLYRILIANDHPVSVSDLLTLSGQGSEDLETLLGDRLRNFLKDIGYTANEVQAVFRPQVSSREAFEWPLPDLVARLDALRTVRSREDFAHLADLTKRVDNILTKRAEDFASAQARLSGDADYTEQAAAAIELSRLVEDQGETMTRLERERRYDEAVNVLADFVAPVERFFDGVLVVDPDEPRATLCRRDLLVRLQRILTRCFDVRELAGQADRRAT